MIEDMASKTALGVSVIRAVHQTVDEIPLILEDPISRKLLNRDTIRQLSSESTKHRSPHARALRSHIVLRSRYAEDRLYAAFLAGTRQYISLGAGYDTFSCRQPAWARELKIIEVDHPSTQAAKIKHFAECGIDFPKNIEFIPIDLEKSGLIEGLSQSKLDCLFRFSCPASASWRTYAWKQWK